MSVILQNRIRARRWLSLWPLALFLLIAAIAGVWLWQTWPQVMIKSIVWQREVNQQLSALLKAVAANPSILTPQNAPEISVTQTMRCLLSFSKTNGVSAEDSVFPRKSL